MLTNELKKGDRVVLKNGTKIRATEVEELLLILEDAYWRLKDLDTQDMSESLEDKVDGLITSLDEYFA